MPSTEYTAHKMLTAANSPPSPLLISVILQTVTHTKLEEWLKCTYLKLKQKKPNALRKCVYKQNNSYLFLYNSQMT